MTCPLATIDIGVDALRAWLPRLGEPGGCPTRVAARGSRSPGDSSRINPIPTKE